jgi:hypothetical protein
MLEFALEYQTAIDNITADRKTDLRRYELNNDDWETARQLCDVMKVWVTAQRDHMLTML